MSSCFRPTPPRDEVFIAVQTAEEKSAIETAIDAAKETCESGTAGACATAWDEVRKQRIDSCSPGVVHARAISLDTLKSLGDIN